VGVARVFVGVNALVAEDDQRLLFRLIETLGDKRIRPNDQRIRGARRFGIRDVSGREAGVFDLIDLGDIPQQHVPHQVVDVLHQLVLTLVGDRCCAGGWSGGSLGRRRRLSEK
jgi:hypothetical protein